MTDSSLVSIITAIAVGLAASIIAEVVTPRLARYFRGNVQIRFKSGKRTVFEVSPGASEQQIENLIRNNAEINTKAKQS